MKRYGKRRYVIVLSLSLLNKDNQLQKDLLINVNVNAYAYASEFCPFKRSITIDNLNYYDNIIITNRIDKNILKLIFV